LFADIKATILRTTQEPISVTEVEVLDLFSGKGTADQRWM
jgi:hypothetical protein